MDDTWTQKQEPPQSHLLTPTMRGFHSGNVSHGQLVLSHNGRFGQQLTNLKIKRLLSNGGLLRYVKQSFPCLYIDFLESNTLKFRKVSKQKFIEWSTKFSLKCQTPKQRGHCTKEQCAL